MVTKTKTTAAPKKSSNNEVKERAAGFINFDFIGKSGKAYSLNFTTLKLSDEFHASLIAALEDVPEEKRAEKIAANLRVRVNLIDLDLDFADDIAL